MQYKGKLNQIKALLSMEVKLEQMKLNDGVTTVEAESFEPDYSIGIVTETGIVPMPVGEYATQDGKVIVVEQEGIIATVADATAEEAMPETAHPSAEATEPQMEQQPKKVVESVSKETFFSLQQELETEKAKNLKLEADLEAIKVELSAKKVELEKTPEPLVYNPENSQKVEMNLLATKRAKSIADKINEKLYGQK